MLEAILDPLHRPAEHAAGMADHDLFGIGPRLAAEAAADVLRDHADVELGNVEDRRDILPDIVVGLGRDPDGERRSPGIEIGDAAAGFERQRGLAPERETARYAAGGGAERALGVAGFVHEGGGDIAGRVRVELRRARRQGRFHGRDRGQRAVIDLDQLGEILGPIAILGDHQGHGLADEAHPVGRQQLRHGLADAGMAEARDQRLVDEGQIARGQHQQRAGRQRSVCIDTTDLGMRHRTADEGGMDHAVEMDVVGEARPPGEKALVFDARLRCRVFGARHCITSSRQSARASMPRRRR